MSGPALAADGPDSVPLIPRATLFGNPDRAGVQISPDGTQVSWLAPVEGVLNVWVAPVGDLSAAKAVTEDTDRGVRQYFWMPNSTHLVYLQDRGGDENWRAYAVDLATGEELDLTPLDG
ncbi:MAG: S9 family peptidase, partial [Planctomycetota bacterium]|nr:S9 family peptidase [Planctomycetota bacterium]